MQYSIRFRPKTLDDVYGNEHIKQYFKNLVKKGKDFPKAIGLSGKYGTGKSTFAYILAKMMVCQNPAEDGTPCCECAACKDIENGVFGRDVMMLDAGTATAEGEKEGTSGKAWTVGKLTDFTRTGPMRDRNKVIILEEIQEFDPSVRKALLKMLEEPNTKKKIHWILLSMDKMPKSGLGSRLQHFSFTDYSDTDVSNFLLDTIAKQSVDDNGTSTIFETLKNDFKLETVQIKDMLSTIVDCSDGSLRQALQILEQCMNTGCVTPSEIKREFKLATDKDTYKLLDGLLDLASSPSQDQQKRTDLLETLSYFEQGDEFYIQLLKILYDAKCKRTFGGVEGEGTKEIHKDNLQRCERLSRWQGLDDLIDDLVKLSPPYNKTRVMLMVMNAVKPFVPERVVVPSLDSAPVRKAARTKV